MGPIEDFANPSSVDHDAATNYGLLAHAVDDVRVGQQKPALSQGPHVTSRARAGNPSHSGICARGTPSTAIISGTAGAVTESPRQELRDGDVGFLGSLRGLPCSTGPGCALSAR